MTVFAAVQMESRLNNTDHNLKAIEERVRDAAAQGAQVAVFPECSLTGYNLTPEEAEAIAESVPGESTDHLVKVCQESNMLMAIGMLERGGDEQIYNSAILLGPAGVLGCYRKTHLPYLGVDRYLAPGATVSGPFTTDYGMLGMLVCYDLRFPEPMRVLALEGSLAVLLPTAWPQAARLYPDFTARTRAEENRVFLVAANHIGEERGVRYLGRSIICAPDGRILAEAGEHNEEILLAEVDLNVAKEKAIIFKSGEYELDLFGDRRPELYGRITSD